MYMQGGAKAKIQRERLFGDGKSGGLHSVCVKVKEKVLDNEGKEQQNKNPECQGLQSGQAGLEMRGGSADRQEMILA